MSTNKIIMIPDHKPLHVLGNSGYSRTRGPLPPTSLPLAVVKGLVNQTTPPLTVLELPNFEKNAKPARLTPNNVAMPYAEIVGVQASAQQVDALNVVDPIPVKVDDVNQEMANDEQNQQADVNPEPPVTESPVETTQDQQSVGIIPEATIDESPDVDLVGGVVVDEVPSDVNIPQEDEVAENGGDESSDETQNSNTYGSNKKKKNRNK